MSDTHDSKDPEKTEVIRPTDDEKTVVLPPDARSQSGSASTGFGGAHEGVDETTVVVPRSAAARAVAWNPSPEPSHSGFPPPRDHAPSAPPPPQAVQPHRANTPGPYGFPGAASQNSGQRSVKKLLIPVAAAVAVVVAVLTVLTILRPGPVKAVLNDKLDVGGAQSQVQSVLTDRGAGYGLTDVGNVVCNRGTDPVISKGETFICEFTVGGRQNQAVMTFLNDSGTYSVGRPQ